MTQNICGAALLPEKEVDPKDHFISRDGHTYAGGHIIADLYGAKRLDDRDFIEATLIKAIEKAGATLIHIHLHVFGDGGGITGVAVLAESHISVHTWPEKSYAAFDIFMCGNANPRLALGIIIEAHNPSRYDIEDLMRGKITT